MSCLCFRKTQKFVTSLSVTFKQLAYLQTEFMCQALHKANLTPNTNYIWCNSPFSLDNTTLQAPTLYRLWETCISDWIPFMPLPHALVIASLESKWKENFPNRSPYVQAYPRASSWPVIILNIAAISRRPGIKISKFANDTAKFTSDKNINNTVNNKLSCIYICSRTL